MQKKQPAAVHATFFLAAAMLWSLDRTPVQSEGIWLFTLCLAVPLLLGFRNVYRRSQLNRQPVKMRSRDSRFFRRDRKY